MFWFLFGGISPDTMVLPECFWVSGTQKECRLSEFFPVKMHESGGNKVYR